MKNFIKSHPIISYTLITFTISWFFWGSSIVINFSDDIFLGVILVGGFGPAIAAFIMMHVQSEKKITLGSNRLFWSSSFVAIAVVVVTYFLVQSATDEAWKTSVWFGLKDPGLVAIFLITACCLFWGLLVSNAYNEDLKENFLTSFLFQKKKIKWYAFALLLFPAIYSLSFGAGKLLGLKTTEALFSPDAGFFIGFILTFIFMGGNEEFGWRGFFQKELQKKYSPLLSAFVIAIAWVFWHLPLHYNGFYPSDFSFISRFTLGFQMALLYTWLYNKSGYSLLSVVILHAMYNNVSDIFGSSYVPAMSIGIVLVLIFIIEDKMWVKKNYHDTIYQPSVLSQESTEL